MRRFQGEPMEAGHPVDDNFHEKMLARLARDSRRANQVFAAVGLVAGLGLAGLVMRAMHLI
jgi:hypothetical protein